CPAVQKLQSDAQVAERHPATTCTGCATGARLDGIHASSSSTGIARPRSRYTEFMRLRWPVRALGIPLLLLLLLATPVCAQRLPPLATPEHYDLPFVVHIARKRFEGTETIHLRID